MHECVCVCLNVSARASCAYIENIYHFGKHRQTHTCMRWRGRERFHSNPSPFICSQAYPFADLFASFGGFSVPHKSEVFNPIMNENQIYALKTENGKVPQVDMLSAETMAKVFEWDDASRAKSRTQPSIRLKAASMCDDNEIPILVIDGNEPMAFIRQSNGKSNDDFNWTNYPKVADIEVHSRHGYKQTLEDIFTEISRSKPSTTPLKYRPIATLTQGGQHAIEPYPTVENMDNNSLVFDENYNNNNKNDEHQITPCTSNLCNGQQIVDRSNFPIFNFFNSFFLKHALNFTRLQRNLNRIRLV